MNPILKVIGLSRSFGGLSALREVSIEVQPGRIVGIIGPNGAGKTTLFNCLSGLYQPTQGQILLRDRAMVPEISGATLRHMRLCALIFTIMGLAWLPLFWSFFLPDVLFKLELILASVFILVMRIIVARGLMRQQMWAFSLVFLFLMADLLFAAWWISPSIPEVLLAGTGIRLGHVPRLWSIGAASFGVYLIIRLWTPRVRQIYGFRPSPDAICRMGMARTFQNIRLFYHLSVLDNVKIGRHGRMAAGVLGSLVKTRAQREEEALTEKQALECLSVVGLKNRGGDLAGALAYGEQRRLEIARALASQPKLLLLDEPAAGMNPTESSQLVQLILHIRDQGITVLIIEHDMRVMMSLADYIYVLDYGRLIAQGTPGEIRNHPKVIEAYLGRGASRVDA